MSRFHDFGWKVSQNHTRTCWVLKCDIRRFFASIDHSHLTQIIEHYIPDPQIRLLLSRIVGSFSTAPDKGLPLGNLTSQLLVNIYMNEFDQFAKHQLKAKHYVRYADDFVFLSRDRVWLESLLPRISAFMRDRLGLHLHPDKVSISTVASGVDFLGWVHFSDHRVLRTTTKRRMFRAITQKEGKEETVQSYLGLMSHGNTKKLRQRVVAYVADTERRGIL